MKYAQMQSIKPFLPVIFLDKVCSNKTGYAIEIVSGNLYRSSEVPINKIPLLKKMGIQRVVNLKTLTCEQYEKLANEYKNAGIEFLNLPINLFNFKKSIPTLIDLINDVKSKKTTLFHCTFGKHRTGGAVAIARNILEKMPMKQAIEDMYKHGFKRIHKMFFFSIKNSLKSFEKNNLKSLA